MNLVRWMHADQVRGPGWGLGRRKAHNGVTGVDAPWSYVAASLMSCVMNCSHSFSSPHYCKQCFQGLGCNRRESAFWFGARDSLRQWCHIVWLMTDYSEKYLFCHKLVTHMYMYN